jgi:S1-C subfamily serine protease
MAPPSTERIRERLLPRSVIGLSVMLVALALGAAFSGAILYAYYEYRLDQTEQVTEELVAGFDEAIERAIDTIREERENARAEIRAELEPLRELAASGETLAALLERVRESIFFVNTLDEGGQPSVGSGFVVFSNPDRSFVLTSYTTIRAATVEPAPPIQVSQGGERVGARLLSWQPERDLALLEVDRGGIEALPWAEGSPPTQVGQRVVAVSGLGTAGGSMSQGFVGDVSSSGIQHDAPIGSHFQGGPLLNSDGEVLAIASRSYAPLGFSPQAVFFGIPIRAACDEILRCPDGEAQGSQ